MKNASLAITVLSLAATIPSCGSSGSSGASGSGGAAGIDGGGAGGGTSSGGVTSGGGAPGATCGNGIVEAGETCDPVASCPASCDDGNACTQDQMTGSAQTCNAACTNTALTTCVAGDGCCPAACSAATDTDCSATCGNGVVDAGETCDPIASCPVSCDDGNTCTQDQMTGSANNCNVACSHTAIAACAVGDGCCPAGCDAATDTDCSASCGNGVLETGETCDPATSCPTSCDDGNACTLDQMTGSAATCNVACSNTAISTCVAGDGCCPTGCNSTTDTDCSATCGNGVVDAGETCDPIASCPTTCDDGDACTVDQMTGSSANCNVACSNTAITACTPGDDCCPAGCDSTTDTDCSGGTGGAAGTGGTAGTGGAATGGAATGGTAGTGGTVTTTGGTAGTGGTADIEGPCDIYASASTPCVGAWSTVRRLYSVHTGPLYQVRRTSDDQTMDIPQLADGFADASVQDDFCPGACTISVLYDQSGRGNDLTASVPTFWLDLGLEADAKALPTTASGHPVYGVYFPPEDISFEPADYAEGTSYRNPSPSGTATGDEPEALYEVVDSNIYNYGCCNSFGNASLNGRPNGPATMEAIYWGACTAFGFGGGSGPWLLADLEAGTFPSTNIEDPDIPSVDVPYYATLMLKGFSGDRFGLKHGNAEGGPLTTQWDGPRPTEEANGDAASYTPMMKEGAIVLGSGGDGSPWSTGSFFEGAMTIGCPDDDAVDDAIQANIVEAGYRN